MLPTLKLTHAHTKITFYLPAGAVVRIESKGEGAMVFTATGSFYVCESADDVAGGYNSSIAWKESQVVQAQLNAAAHVQKQQQSGLLVPRMDLNGN